MERKVYEKQNGICAICGKLFEIEQMEADHITRGISEAKPLPRTARCSAATAIGARAGNEDMPKMQNPCR